MNSPGLRLPPINHATIHHIIPRTPDAGIAIQRAAAGVRQAFDKDEGGRMNSPGLRLPPINHATIHHIIPRTPDAGIAIQRAAVGAQRPFHTTYNLAAISSCLTPHSRRGNCDPTRCVGGGAGRAAPNKYTPVFLFMSACSGVLAGQPQRLRDQFSNRLL